MPHANPPEQEDREVTIAPFPRATLRLDARQPQSKARTGCIARVAALADLLPAWWRRKRQKHEAAGMPGGDFADVTLPPHLAGDEARRWPWHQPTPPDGAPGVARGRAYRGPVGRF